MQRVHIIVNGHVQGVFFRHYTKKTAVSLGLKGYAKNKEDGTVEVVAEGPEDKLKELIAFCKKGPEAAEVSNIDIKFEKASNEFKDFSVRF
ncbi:MAG: acylphosphatase [Nanoarchaeota archaeon]|nr:acylphosphatase [Nanoarchaeota archaeon]